MLARPGLVVEDDDDAGGWQQRWIRLCLATEKRKEFVVN